MGFMDATSGRRRKKVVEEAVARPGGPTVNLRVQWAANGLVGGRAVRNHTFPRHPRVFFARLHRFQQIYRVGLAGHAPGRLGVEAGRAAEDGHGGERRMQRAGRGARPECVAAAQGASNKRWQGQKIYHVSWHSRL